MNVEHRGPGRQPRDSQMSFEQDSLGQRAFHEKHVSPKQVILQHVRNGHVSINEITYPGNWTHDEVLTAASNWYQMHPFIDHESVEFDVFDLTGQRLKEHKEGVQPVQERSLDGITHYNSSIKLLARELHRQFPNLRQEDIAERLGVSRSVVGNWLREEAA